MKKYVVRVSLLALLLSGVFIFNPFESSYERMYGTVNFINKEEKQITINTSAWAEEKGLKDTETDILFVETAVIGENTIIKSGDGNAAAFNDIFTGQKVSIMKDKKSDVIKELILNID